MFCSFLIQLAPGALAIALYLLMDQNIQLQQECMDARLMIWSEKKLEAEEKQKAVLDEIVLKYDKRTTLLRDKVALLEKNMEYLDGVDRRIAVIVTTSIVSVVCFYWLVLFYKC
jgi:hypothetical protein